MFVGFVLGRAGTVLRAPTAAWGCDSPVGGPAPTRPGASACGFPARYGGRGRRV